MGIVKKVFDFLFYKEVKVPARQDVREKQSQPPATKSYLPDIAAAIEGRRITGRIADGVQSDMNMVLSDGLLVEGVHNGSLVITSDIGVVWISDTGVVNGDVTAQHVYIAGRVTGSVKADRVVLEGSAVVSGQIIATQVLLRNIRTIDVHASVVSHSESLKPAMSCVVVPIAQAQAAVRKAA